MPNVVVWGKTRDLIAGDLPAGMPIAEVGSLDEARAQGDGRGTLLLTDPATLETHEKDLEAWLRGAGATHTLLVVVAEAAAGDDVLRRFLFVHDLVIKPVTAARLKLRLDRAFEALKNRRAERQLEDALKRKGDELSELNKIGVALSAERDINKLLDLILKQSRDITSADAGSLYLVERGKDQNTQTDDLLRFKLTQNDSVVVPFEEFTLPLSPASIAGYVALTGQALNLGDAYHLPSDVPYSGSGGAARSFDEKSGYRTKSMLVVPMKDHKEEVIGVVQLINKKKDPQVVLRPVAVVDEEVIAFTEGDRDLVTSLASQAAVAYENTLLIERLKQLFDSFIRASVTTIEKRDPVTSGHSEGVAILTVDLAQRVNAATTGRFGGQRFSNEQIQEIRYASLLHDFGKVGVMEKYLRKAKKLYGSHQQLIEQRFECIQRTLEVDYLEAKMRQIEAGAPRDLIADLDQAYQARRDEVHQLLLTVRKANEPTILEDDGVKAAIQDLGKRTYRNLEGKELPFLEAEEVTALSIRRGSLTEEERDKINEHVQNTYDFLEKLPWTSDLRKVPEIAWKHHAKLDGSGYPKPWKGDEIPIQSRMMTIADIFDALTAWDRPYKKAVPVEKALDILKKEEAGRGKIDSDLVDLFIEAKVYEGEAYRTLHLQRVKAAAAR